MASKPMSAKEMAQIKKDYAAQAKASIARAKAIAKPVAKAAAKAAPMDMAKIKKDYAAVAKASIAKAKSIAAPKPTAKAAPMGMAKIKKDYAARSKASIAQAKAISAMGKPAPKSALMKSQDDFMANYTAKAKGGKAISGDEAKAMSQIMRARAKGGNFVGPKIVGPKKAPKGMK